MSEIDVDARSESATTRNIVDAPLVDRWLQAAAGRAASAARTALDLLLPPHCPITNEAVERPGVLSAAGWAQLKFIDDPVCAHCGIPFAYEIGEGATCAACIADPPAFDRARAGVVYDDASHRLNVAFKHSDRTELAPLFAAQLKRSGAPLLTPDTILVPTSLHPIRLWKRRYNQAGLLAALLARSSGCAVDHSLLKRVRATPPQQSLSAEGRRRNVPGAFGLSDERRDFAKGRRFVLIDDVLTTGATLSAAARALKKVGAARVDALAVARVVKDGTDAL